MQQLPQEDRALIERKYAAPFFKDLPPEHLELSAFQILIKIHVITGWKLPEEPEFRAILIEQFKLKLTESYPHSNSEEIEYAMRTNREAIDYGKSINLSLIDDVMIPYLNSRRISSEKERDLMPEQPQLPPVPVSDEEVIKYSKEVYYSTENFHFIPYKVYDRLFNRGDLKVTNEEREDIKKSVTIIILKEAADDPQMFKDISRETYMIRQCKKMAVARYFDKIKEI